MPRLRRAVSSTEMLYEKAVARFYEAVELEEASKSKSRKWSENVNELEKISERLGSIKLEKYEEQLLQKEEPKEPQINLNRKNDSFEEDSLESENYRKDSMDYASDYTESTVGSSEDSIEDFKTQVARTHLSNNELATYHYSGMNMSPYRSPSPHQSAVVLNKPLPPPNPEFIPKPILKRPSAENVVKDESNKKPETNENSDKNKPKENTFNFMNVFKKDKPNKSDENKIEGESNKIDSKSLSEPKSSSSNLTKNVPIKLNEQIQVKRQSFEEETKVVVDYYSDIVKEMGHVRNRGIPLYLRGTDSNKSDEEKEKQDEKFNENKKTEEELIAKSIEKPRLSIVERLQSVHVQNHSKLAIEKPLSTGDDVKVEKKENNEEFKKSNESVELKKQNKSSNNATIGKDKRKSNIKAKAQPKSRISKLSQKNSEISQKQDFSFDENKKESKTSSKITNEQINNEENIIIISKDIKKYEEEMEPPPKTPEQILDEVQENVRSTISYIIDVGLFIVACWVYIFKDVRLVLPILGLLVYRQLGEALNAQIPDWMKRKNT